MIRRLTTFALTAGAAFALFTPAAQAAPVAAHKPIEAASDCHHADTPTQTGRWVHSKGWSNGCRQTIYVHVQRLRAWGWVIEANASYRAPGSAVASFDCLGNGHYTYRTLIQWRDGAGTPHSRTSAEARFNC
jgi:hypothetical protein